MEASPIIPLREPSLEQPVPPEEKRGKLAGHAMTVLETIQQTYAPKIGADMEVEKRLIQRQLNKKLKPIFEKAKEDIDKLDKEIALLNNQLSSAKSKRKISQHIKKIEKKEAAIKVIVKRAQIEATSEIRLSERTKLSHFEKAVDNRKKLRGLLRELTKSQIFSEKDYVRLKRHMVVIKAAMKEMKNGKDIQVNLEIIKNRLSSIAQITKKIPKKVKKTEKHSMALLKGFSRNIEEGVKAYVAIALANSSSESLAIKQHLQALAKGGWAARKIKLLALFSEKGNVYRQAIRTFQNSETFQKLQKKANSALKQLFDTNPSASFKGKSTATHHLIENVLKDEAVVLYGTHKVLPMQSPTLEYSYVAEVNGKPKVLGKQVITRSDVLTPAVKYCNEMLKICQRDEKLLMEENPDPSQEIQDKLQLLRDDIEFYKEQMVNIEEYQNDPQNTRNNWLHSNYWRDLIANSKDYDTARKKYIAAPINIRNQELQIGGKTTMSVSRYGVISDMTNGWVSLNELKWLKGKSREIDIKIKTLQKLMNKEKSKNKRQSIQFAIEQLVRLKTEPDRVIHRRETILNMQMALRLNDQIQRNLGQIGADINRGVNHLDIFDFRLLDFSKVKTDKTGWRHDEVLQFDDNKAAFDLVNGKQVVYDGTGPSIDGEVIHLPYRIPGHEEASMKLSTYIVNNSVQKYRSNEGFQSKANREALSRYAEDHPEIAMEHDFQRITANLTDETVETSFETVVEAEAWVLSSPSDRSKLVSNGCLSSKDRGGLKNELLMQKGLEHQYESAGLNPNHLFDEALLNGPLLDVIRENGSKAIKASAYPEATGKMRMAGLVLQQIQGGKD